EMSFLHRPFGVGDEREVGVVDLLLVHELLALRPSYGRQRTVLHRLRPFPVAGDHLIDVEFGHLHPMVRRLLQSITPTPVALSWVLDGLAFTPNQPDHR